MEKAHSSDHTLYSIITTIENPETCAKFFEDLCSTKELIAIEQRLDVATYLEQGLPYLKIMELTGASSATISRVRRFMLDQGSGGVAKSLITQYIQDSQDKEVSDT